MRRVAGLLFAAVTILSLDLRTMIVPVAKPAETRLNRARSADNPPWARFSPGFVPFINGVRGQTKNGDTIALVLSPGDTAGYSFAYYRASYLLAGRRVIPIYDDAGRMRSERIAEARYLALFRQTYSGPGEVVWRGAEGLLVRQR